MIATTTAQIAATFTALVGRMVTVTIALSTMDMVADNDGTVRWVGRTSTRRGVVGKVEAYRDRVEVGLGSDHARLHGTEFALGASCWSVVAAV